MPTWFPVLAATLQEAAYIGNKRKGYFNKIRRRDPADFLMQIL